MKHIKRWKQNRKGTNKREMMTYSRYVGNHIVSLKSLASREFKLNACLGIYLINTRRVLTMHLALTRHVGHNETPCSRRHRRLLGQ